MAWPMFKPEYALEYAIFAFEYAEALNKKFPQSWTNNKMAGINWIKSYMK